MAGLIVEMLCVLCSVYKVFNGLKISEYEAYRLTDFSQLNIVEHQKINSGNDHFFEAACTTYLKANK